MIPSEQFEIGGHQFTFKALPSIKARALGVRLLKHLSGVLPQAKNELGHAFTMRGLGGNTQGALAVIFSSAVAIDQLIDNLQVDVMEGILKDILPNILVEVDMGEGKEPMWRASNDQSNDFFANRLGLQLQVVTQYIQWTYADFFGGALLAKLDGLKSLALQLTRIKKTDSKESTGGTTESSPASNTEDNSYQS